MVPPPSPAPDADAVADAVIAASRILVQATIDALAAFAPDLNLTDLRVLAVLDRQGPQRLIDVAEALDVTPTTATRLADRLAQRGMVERMRQSDDRREIHLAIAPAGRQLVRAVFQRRRRFVSQRCRGLSTADQAAAVKVLDQIAAGANLEVETA